jgi:hypothetical protein
MDAHHRHGDPAIAGRFAVEDWNSTMIDGCRLLRRYGGPCEPINMT